MMRRDADGDLRVDEDGSRARLAHARPEHRHRSVQRSSTTWTFRAWRAGISPTSIATSPHSADVAAKIRQSGLRSKRTVPSLEGHPRKCDTVEN